VTGCDFLAYSCAAARELHPLPCLCHGAKTRKPKDISISISKIGKILVRGIYRGVVLEVNPPGHRVVLQFAFLQDGVIPSVAVFQAKRGISRSTGLARKPNSPLPVASQISFPSAA